MGVTSVVHKRNFSASSGKRIFSPNIWADCPLDVIRAGAVDAVLFEDDFLNAPLFASATSQSGYITYQDTGVTIKGIADEDGVLEIAGNDSDNDEGSLTTGANVATMFKISDTASEAKKLWFECRYKKASVANDALAFFIGLSEEGCAAADALADGSGAVAQKDLIGFNVLHADGDAVNFIYRKGTGAVQTISGVHTMVAGEYVNLGFRYDPTASDSKKIKIFVNNVEQSTYVTATDIAASTFPDGEELAMLIATKVGTNSNEVKSQLDWWAACQLG